MHAAEASSLIPDAPLAATDSFHELETKYIFGFTEGRDNGEEGEKSIEFETTGAFGMRRGSFAAIEHEAEFEGVPTQFFGYELTAHGLLQSVNNIDGLDNFHDVNFSGLSAELRFLLIDRGPGSPIGLTFTVEPEWARVDDVSGALTSDFGTTLRLVADTELIPNRLYAAANLIYEPDISREFGDTKWQQSSNLGMTAAMAHRIAPKVTLGGDTGLFMDSACNLRRQRLVHRPDIAHPVFQQGDAGRCILDGGFRARGWRGALFRPHEFPAQPRQPSLKSNSRA